ncbi:MAG: ABC-type transport auxiliary lipoprotein family protein [Phreatobacter sp.]|uniref:ABC-type transport auxiliary lipoprotein family protein n=1 Tax=Phreatobacter sp. TaxID=1966341 RepID=UPI002734D0F6|nr:ABC-type transport auxiliary lipoprotein family protein [Phreatobacter sp.]MDP2800506.1 ABC-type transport auxiliary lipoprotein family protein [Phreatobacter sp.]
MQHNDDVTGSRRAGRSAALAATLAVALALAGCASSSSVPRSFDISAPSTFPTLAGAVRGQLLVVEPKAIASLDTERIAVRGPGGAYSYLTDGAWADRLPKLLQARLIQSFENANRLRSVGRPGDRLASDWQLLAEVRAFEVVVTGASEVVVEMSVKIVNDRSGRILSGRVFSARAPAAGTDAISVSAAFNGAVQSLLREIVLWSTGQV